MKSVAFLLFVLLIGCQDIQKSSNSITQSNVINGEKVTVESEADISLSTIGLARSQDEAPVCTGVLIAFDIVLTAAHCLVDDENKPEDIKLVVFGPELKISADGYENFRLIKDIIIHPKYNSTDNNYDIALVFIDEAPKNYRPATLFNSEFNEDLNIYLYASGLSLTSTDNIHSAFEQLTLNPGNYKRFDSNFSQDDEFARISILFRAVAPFVPEDKIDNTFDKVLTISNLGHLYKGDSGGGLFIKINNQFYLLGINSFMGEGDNNESLVFTAATSIFHYRNWIINSSKRFSKESIRFTQPLNDEDILARQSKGDLSCFDHMTKLFTELYYTIQLRDPSTQVEYCESRKTLPQRLKPLIETCNSVCPDKGATKGFCSFYEKDFDKFYGECEKILPVPEKLEVEENLN